MYDIILLLILLILFFNKDIYERFVNNEGDICYLEGDIVKCDFNYHKYKLLEEKEKLKEIEKNPDNKKLSDFEIDIENIQQKIKEIENELDTLENEIDDDDNYMLDYTNEENIENEGKKYLTINRFVNISIIIFISIGIFFLLYYLTIFIIDRKKVEGLRVDPISLDFNELLKHMKIEKLKKKYKINF
tara:strand:- start:223 stop:786 length:564 start_codon:yes stop_codon:yes gene_type:complete